MPKNVEINQSKSKKESSSKANSNNASEHSLLSVKAADFDVKNYRLEPIKESKDFQGGGSQYNAFPRYIYNKSKNGDTDKAESECQRMIVITKPIKISKGGVPKVDGQFRKTENDCLYFWLPLLDNDEGGKELYDHVLGPLDEYNDKKINKEGNKNFVVRVDEKSGKTLPIKQLKYSLCAKEYTPGLNDGEDVSDDEDTKKKSKDKDGNPKEDEKPKEDGYKRVKVRLATLFEKDIDENAPKKIKTRVFINDTNGAPKEQPEKINTMTDIRKFFLWNCTAQFALEFNKFWVMKNLDHDTKVRKCSIGVKCIQMYISIMPEFSKVGNELGMSVFGFKPKQIENKKEESDEDSDSNSKKKQSKGKVDKKKAESESDEESGSDNSDESSEDETPKEQSKKGAKEVKKETKKSESESDNDSDKESDESDKSGEDSDSDSKKKSAKKVAPKKDDSDEDSDNDTKKKGSKKASKKDDSDEESEDEKPAKQPKKGAKEDEKPKPKSKGK